MTLELEVWEAIVLFLLPEVTFAVGLWLGVSWRRESVRALRKSVEDRDAALRRVGGVSQRERRGAARGGL